MVDLIFDEYFETSLNGKHNYYCKCVVLRKVESLVISTRTKSSISSEPNKICVGIVENSFSNKRTVHF